MNLVMFSVFRNRRWGSPAAEHFGRDLEQPVSPKDGFVIARLLVIAALAVVAGSFSDGATSQRLALLLMGVALLQPALPLFGSDQASFRLVQVVADVLTCVLVMLLAPAYFWFGVIGAVSVIANFAVLTPMRRYGPVALFSVVAIGAVAAWNNIDQFERATAVLAILAAGHGYMGARTRRSMSAARGDLLAAIGAAGGFAYVCDLESGRIVDVAGDVERVVGWDKSVWKMVDHRDLIHPDDRAAFWIDFDDAKIGEYADRTARFRRPDGTWVWIRDLTRVVMIAGRPSLRGFSIDVSSQQDGLARVENEAATDELTGLPNRRALLAELAAREHEVGHHLVLIDLNRFKGVNDTLGHDAGDELLEIVADRVSACLRPADVLARLGGDEFAIIFESALDSTDVAAEMDRIAFEVERPAEVSGVVVTVSLSAGIVRAGTGASDPLTMLRHSDISMYAAKRACVTSVVFDRALEAVTSRQAAIAGSLTEALDSGDLCLHFQPIIEVATGRMAGVEGLARWSHADYGLLTPRAFLDTVLMSEQAGEFTRRMVLHGVAAARELASAGIDATVAVNLPVRVLEDPAFNQFVLESCTAKGVSADRLVFEIAEQDIHHTVSITTAIDRIVEMGSTVSVDDFGTGHATFERLRWGNVEQLKLGNDAIRDAVECARDRTILKSVLALAAELGYSVVAEGVETREQLDLLRTFGCPLVQGHFFARAMPISDVIEFAAPQRARGEVESLSSIAPRPLD